jgi:hypothetical protein
LGDNPTVDLSSPSANDTINDAGLERQLEFRNHVLLTYCYL